MLYKKPCRTVELVGPPILRASATNGSHHRIQLRANRKLLKILKVGHDCLAMCAWCQPCRLSGARCANQAYLRQYKSGKVTVHIQTNRVASHALFLPLSLLFVRLCSCLIQFINKHRHQLSQSFHHRYKLRQPSSSKLALVLSFSSRTTVTYARELIRWDVSCRFPSEYQVGVPWL